MVAIKYSELLEGESLQHDDRYEINHNVNIDPSVRMEPFIVIDNDVTIGKNTIIGPFVQIRPNSTIGYDCKIGGNTIIEGNVVIGNKVRVGTHCNFGWGVCISDGVFIGNGFIGANDHEMVWNTKNQNKFKPEPLIIEDNVKIGLKCTTTKGLTIGKNSIIGAGSLLTRDVPPNVLTYGNPAKVIKKL